MENENIVHAEETVDEGALATTETDADQDAEVLDPPRFVVKTNLNAAVQMEASKALAPKYANVTSLAGIGLLVVLLVFTIVQYFTLQSNDRLFMAALLIAVIAFLLYSRYSAPKRALKRWEANMRRSFGTDAMHLTTEFFEHSLAQTAQETNDLIVEGYSKIYTMRETEHLLLLRCSAQSWFFLEKDGLVDGDLDELKDFIRERIGVR